MKLSPEWISVVVAILIPTMSGIFAQIKMLWSLESKVDSITANYRNVMAEIEQIKRRLEELEQELRHG